MWSSPSRQSTWIWRDLSVVGVGEGFGSTGFLEVDLALILTLLHRLYSMFCQVFAFQATEAKEESKGNINILCKGRKFFPPLHTYAWPVRCPTPSTHLLHITISLMPILPVSCNGIFVISETIEVGKRPPIPPWEFALVRCEALAFNSRGEVFTQLVR